jgi:hypothetical protein
MNDDLWICIDSDTIVTLDVHGRCSVCGSNAVVRRSFQHLTLLAKLYPEAEQVEVLEKLWLKD